ncbi:hypothetical protein, partial [Rhizobium johnstonii]|uniref:hypothetical protein n=1 Tax=Rhizobium johnstonii TaxID=3019933 RepID=UPI003F965844
FVPERLLVIAISPNRSGKAIEINLLDPSEYEGFANFLFVQILCCKCLVTMHKLSAAQATN